MGTDSESNERQASATDLVVEEHVIEEHAGTEDGAGGLELDDFQSQEIRQIFLTTLPEYLEPVAEMLEQLLAGGDRAAAVSKPLDTTLGSVAMAASRVGIVDVATVLEGMRASAAEVLQHPAPIPDALRNTLFGALDELRRVAAGGSPRVEAPRPGSRRTVVAALTELGGFDPSVLERLSGAGLVTVDQLLMAEISEIVAVSGLNVETVRELCGRVRALEAGQPQPVAERNAGAESDAVAASRAVQSHGSVEAPAAEPHAVVERAGGPAPSADDPAPSVASAPTDTLVERLHEQVELEVSVDRTRARVVRMRVRVATLRDELVSEERRRNELRAALQGARDQLAQRLLLLSTTRATQAQNRREADERRRALQASESRRAELVKARDLVASEHERTSTEMAELLTRVRRMLDALSEPEQQASNRRALGEPSRRVLG